MSWNLSPEDLHDADCLPSLWRLQETAAMLLVLAIIGLPGLHHLIHAGPRMHRRLANSSRKRKPHLAYPLNGLF